MSTKQMLATCLFLLVADRFLPAQESPEATAPAPSAPTAAQDGLGASEHQERMRRLAEIRSLTDRELIDKLAETSVLDAEVGLPLLRERAFSRIAHERAEFDAVSLGGIPQVQAAEEVLRRPDVQAKLNALLSKPPREMWDGFLALVNENKLAIEDLQLLAEYRETQDRLAEYKRWQNDVEVRLQSHVAAARTDRNPISWGVQSKMYEKMEEQRRRLKDRAMASATEDGGGAAVQTAELPELLKRLTSQGRKP